MKDVLKHKDFIGSGHFSAEDDCFFGRIEGIDDLVNFEGRAVGDLKKAFREAVKDYMGLRQSAGKPLNKSCKRSLNVRMTTDLHKRAARKSAMLGISLNQVVQRAVEKDVRRP